MGSSAAVFRDHVAADPGEECARGFWVADFLELNCHQETRHRLLHDVIHVGAEKSDLVADFEPQPRPELLDIVGW
jgi:hypothetical protein